MKAKKPDKTRIALIVALCAAGIVILCLAGLMLAPAGSGGADKSVDIRIERGDSAGHVAAMLRGENLIRSRFLFQALLKMSGADRKLEAGTYRIPRGATLPSIVLMLAQGRMIKIPVTVPEGYTSRAIAELLDGAGVCPKNEFFAAVRDPELARKLDIPAKGFEGFLFPDTYIFSGKTDAESILRTMTQNFFAKVSALAPGGKIDGSTLFDDVRLASIVEREYRVESEAGLIASVFKNRLRIGMALQSCATVVYVITENLGRPHPSVLHYKDLAIKDPYNTYLNRGLPPGPISNPGATSLKAVFNSPKSDYLYFRLADAAEGRHKFSRTFEEHVEEAIPVKGF